LNYALPCYLPSSPVLFLGSYTGSALPEESLWFIITQDVIDIDERMSPFPYVDNICAEMLG
jgi:hypothetical protein